MKMSDVFAPLGERIKKNEYKKPDRLAWIVSIIVPFIVYSFLSVAFTIIVAYALRFVQDGKVISGVSREYSIFLAMAIRILSVILAVAPLIVPFFFEKPVLVHREGALRGCVIVGTMAVALSLGLNSIAILTGFATNSQSFSDTASNQFSLPIWAGIIVYGIVTPVTEEIVYRGLIYNRARKYMNVIAAIICSSFLFGLSHGNYVQLVYGFCMGLILCYIYERFGAFIYPVLFHCLANTAVYICMSIAPIKKYTVSVPGAVIEMIIAGACLIVAGSLKKADKC